RQLRRLRGGTAALGQFRQQQLFHGQDAFAEPVLIGRLELAEEPGELTQEPRDTVPDLVGEADGFNLTDEIFSGVFHRHLGLRERTAASYPQRRPTRRPIAATAPSEKMQKMQETAKLGFCARTPMPDPCN